MEIKILDFSKVTNWTPDMIQAFHAQQQTLLMERQAEALESLNRTVGRLWEMADDQRRTYELALNLMTSRETVMFAFEGRSAVPLSKFRDRLTSMGIRAFSNRLRAAIPLTDYLVLVPTGNGFRVWRAEDYVNSRAMEKEAG